MSAPLTPAQLPALTEEHMAALTKAMVLCGHPRICPEGLTALIARVASDGWGWVDVAREIDVPVGVLRGAYYLFMAHARAMFAPLEETDA